MKTETRWYWLVKREQFDSHSAHSVIDLLRYDGARPESNAPTGFYLFSCEKAGHPKGPVIERLKSYSIVPAKVVGPCSADEAHSVLWSWMHQQSAAVQAAAVR